MIWWCSLFGLYWECGVDGIDIVMMFEGCGMGLVDFERK